MKRATSIFTFILLLTIISCGPSIRTVNPYNQDLGIYNSFAYLPNTNIDVPGKNYTDEDINRSIVEAVKSNMLKNGFELDRENPDLLVLISTSTDIETETTTEPVYATYPYTTRVGAVSPYYGSYYYTGYNNYSGIVGYDTDTYSYKEGTVVINLIDRTTKKTVWKGVGTDAIYNQTKTSAIQRMVDEIFEELPVNR